MNGMFGSIYNNPMQMYGMNGMMSMGGISCNPYGNQALGFQLAMTGLNVIGMALNGSFGSSESIHSNYDGRGTGNADNESKTIAEQIEDVNNSISDLNTDRTALEAELAAPKISKTFDDNINAAKIAYNAFPKSADEDSNIKQLKSEIPADVNDPNYNAKMAQYSNAVEQFELNKAAAKTKFDEAVAAKENAVKQAQELIQGKIDGIDKEVKTLTTKLEKLEAKAAKLEKSEILNLTGKMDNDEYAKLFDKNNNLVLTGSSALDYKAAMNTAMRSLAKTKPEDTEGRKKYATQIVQLYKEIPESERTKLMDSCYNQANTILG